MIKTILPPIYFTAVFLVPLVFLIFTKRRFWKYGLHKKLYQSSLAVRREEFTFQAGPHTLDTVAQENNLGNKIIVSKHLYEQAEDLINGIWREMILSYGMYIVLIMIISGLAVVNIKHDERTLIDGIIDYVNTFWGYLLFPLGFILAHTLRFIKYFYLRELLDKPKYLEIIDGPVRHGVAQTQ